MVRNMTSRSTTPPSGAPEPARMDARHDRVQLGERHRAVLDVEESLRDRPGALAQVAAALGDAGVSIDRMRQREHQADVAPVLIVTHPTPPEAVADALGRIGRTGITVGETVSIRIEKV